MQRGKLRLFLGKHFLTSVYLLLIIAILTGCTKSAELEKELLVLNNTASAINEDLIRYRHFADTLSFHLADIYEMESKDFELNPEKYSMHNTGVFYKNVNDGKTAVFVTGFNDITQDVKNIVYKTEYIEDTMIDIYIKSKSIIQIYYNDVNNYNRIYPYFDVLSQYKPNTNITSFNFFYEADPKHNPDKKSVWVSAPYLDPAGRGWMISAISPVYAKSKFEGVSGIDIVIADFFQSYLDNQQKGMMIVSSSGYLIHISDILAMNLDLPKIGMHKYIAPIVEEQVLEDQFNLNKHRKPEIRKLSDEIINNSNSFKMELKSKNYRIIKSKIPELDWYLVKLINLD
jgi:hypothetical protein